MAVRASELIRGSLAATLSASLFRLEACVVFVSRMLVLCDEIVLRPCSCLSVMDLGDVFASWVVYGDDECGRFGGIRVRYGCRSSMSWFQF